MLAKRFFAIFTYSLFSSIATESSYALTKLGFEHIGIDQIQMHLNIENAASAKIPEKLTYKLETTRKWVKKKYGWKKECRPDLGDVQ